MASTGVTERRPLVGDLTRNFDSNALDPVRTLGRLGHLIALTITSFVGDTFRGRLKLKEAVIQGWYLVSVTALPAFLMAIPFGVIVSLQIGNLIEQIGAQSLLGAASGFAVIQQGAPLASGMLLGGAGASAIAADLGARNIREEIDAMRVMGIDPINRLVVPRVLATVIVAPLLAMYIIVVGVLASYYLAITQQGVTPGSYWLSFGAFSNVRDVGLALLKASIFGAMVAVIGCQRGLEARNGPRGVADGVNATVVISSVAIIIVNLVLTQIYAVFFPLELG